MIARPECYGRPTQLQPPDGDTACLGHQNFLCIYDCPAQRYAPAVTISSSSKLFLEWLSHPFRAIQLHFHFAEIRTFHLFSDKIVNVAVLNSNRVLYSLENIEAGGFPLVLKAPQLPISKSKINKKEEKADQTSAAQK